MGKPPQRRLNTANQNRHIPVGLTNQVTVYDCCVVGTFAHDTAGGEGIGFAPVLGDGIVVHHGVHIAAGNQKAQTWLAVDIDGPGILPVRLGDDAYGITVTLKNSADDGVAEGRVVNVCVADDIDKIALCPAPINHILLAYGQKRHILPPILVSFTIVPEKRYDEKRKILERFDEKKRNKKVLRKSAQHESGITCG